MTRKKFYKRCTTIGLIAVLTLIAGCMLLMYASGSDNKTMILISSFIVFASLLTGIITTVLSLGNYKPSLPNMPFPIICYPNKYAIVHLEQGWWVINYYETKEETIVDYSIYITNEHKHVYVYEKVYTNEKGYHNKRIS